MKTSYEKMAHQAAYAALLSCAYELGAENAKSGQPASANPYPVGQMHDSWERGHRLIRDRRGAQLINCA